MRRCGATAWSGTDGWLRYRGGSERTRPGPVCEVSGFVYRPVSRRRTGRRHGVNSEFVTGPSGRPATVWVRPLVTAGSFSRIWVSCIRVGGRARNTRWTWCPKDRPDIVVDVADVIDVIVRVAGTGKIGDGKGMDHPHRNRGPGPRQRARPGSPVGPCRQTPVVTAGGSLTANARSITSSVARGRAVDRHIMWRTDQTGAAMLPIGQSAAAAASRAPGAAGGRAGYGSPIPRVVVVEGVGSAVSGFRRPGGTLGRAGVRASGGRQGPVGAAWLWADWPGRCDAGVGAECRGV